MGRGHRFDNGQFAGVALGKGPVQPLIGAISPRAAKAALRGVLVFARSPQHPRWFTVKTLWFSKPAYDGATWLRARNVKGAGPVRFGHGADLTDPLLSAGPTMNGERGFREWPGATWVQQPGCYAWQVDGTNFSDVIVFEARTQG